MLDERARKRTLLSEIEQLDFSEIDAWVENLVKKPAAELVPPNLEPPPYYAVEPSDTEQKELYSKAEQLGTVSITVAAAPEQQSQPTRTTSRSRAPVPVKPKTSEQVSESGVYLDVDDPILYYDIIKNSAEIAHGATVMLFMVIMFIIAFLICLLR